MKRSLFSVFCLLACCAIGMAQNKACPDEAYRLFDFWIGEWEVTANGKLAGHNSIQPILDGCVLQEMWRGASGSQGSSFNYYNPDTKKWNQYWVWANGRPLPQLTGHFKDGKMVLSGMSKGKDGTEVIDRISWFKNEDGTVRQLWEKSKDGGKSWQTAFDGHYKKVKQ